jgi:hypothetical protein
MQNHMHSQSARIVGGAVLLLALVSAVFAGPAPTASKCKLVVVAQVPVDMHGLRPVIPLTIDGHPSSMLIDTGATTSFILRGAAAAFGLKSAPGGGKNYAAGGIEYSGRVEVHDFDVGGFMVHNLTLNTMGHGTASEKVAGALGEDFLSHWDEEFDPAAGVVRLLVPKDCKGDQVLYWATQYSVVKLLTVVSRDANWSALPLANLQLNGHDVLTLFDTGAPYSIVTIDVAKSPAMRPIVEVATDKRGRGLASGTYAVDTAVFPSITIGQETIQNPRMEVADIFAKDKEVRTGSMIASSPEGQPQMLIGMDFFRAHHVYLARGQQKMYFTYVGGPVFLTATELATVAKPAPSSGAAAPAPATPTPVTPTPAGTSDPAAPK